MLAVMLIAIYIQIKSLKHLVRAVLVYKEDEDNI